MKNKIVITIDKEIMNEYEKIYFKMNPRCRVFPKYFKNPIPMSWNGFIVKKRMAQNDMKGKYKDFAIWLCAKYKIAGLKLNKVCITYKYYFGDRRGRDVDNYTLGAKLINDGLVGAGVLIDDISKYLELKFPPHEYDKVNPRLEMTIEY